jgi:hypothetical protein
MRVLRNPHKPRTKKRPWKFFALTQACQQTRAEFRPLWIYDLSVRLLSTSCSGAFVDTFLHHTAEFKHAPKLLQTCWEHGYTPRVDITPLLRLVASCPSSRVDMVPYKVACGELMEFDVCNNCLQREYQEDHGLDYDSDLEDCDCPDYDMVQEE